MYYFFVLLLIVVASYTMSGGLYKPKPSTVQGQAGELICEPSSSKRTTQIMGCSFIADESSNADEKVKQASEDLKNAEEKGDEVAFFNSGIQSVDAYVAASLAYQEAQSAGNRDQVNKALEQLNSSKTIALTAQGYVQGRIPVTKLIEYANKAKTESELAQNAVNELLASNDAPQKYPSIRRAIDASNKAIIAQAQVEGKLRADSSTNLGILKLLLPNYLNLITVVTPKTSAQTSGQITEVVISGKRSLMAALRTQDNEKLKLLFQQLLKAEERLSRTSADEIVLSAKQNQRN